VKAKNNTDNTTIIITPDKKRADLLVLKNLLFMILKI
jgi:hypothetical protein